MTDEFGDDPRYSSKLQVIASDVTTAPVARPAAGRGPARRRAGALSVARAVRMSMSIPIFFEPVCHKNEQTNRTHLIVDGGMLSNFPVWLFDCDGSQVPDWPTFGLLLVEPNPKTQVGERLPEPEKVPRGIGGLLKYMRAMASTMMEAHDRMYVETAEFARTIPVPTLGIGTTEFEITEARKEALYQSGRDAATDFLASWDFDAYIAEFRKGKEKRRRDTVTEQMQGAAAP